MKFTVYCDESRHSGGNGNQFAVIGGLWIRTDCRDDFSMAVRNLKKDGGINAELKWSKVSSLKYKAYKAVIDEFFSHNAVNYRAIIVDQTAVDYESFHDGDRELGFYKFYYEMLEKWIVPENEYTVLLDYKNNKDSKRLTSLKSCLENYARVRNAEINELTSIDSRQSHIAQLCDILTGAVAADANGVPTDTAKHRLTQEISASRGTSPLSSPSRSPEFSKFNIFRINLK